MRDYDSTVRVEGLTFDVGLNVEVKWVIYRRQEKGKTYQGNKNQIRRNNNETYRYRYKDKKRKLHGNLSCN